MRVLPIVPSLLFTHRCKADSDDNIFDSGDPHSPRYIGRHPGAAFLELQFYPPGWVSSFTATQYAVALQINSYSVKAAGPKGPKPLRIAGSLRFAIECEKGKGNRDPNKQTVLAGETLLMNPGDTLIVTVRDTEDGLAHPGPGCHHGPDRVHDCERGQWLRADRFRSGCQDLHLASLRLPSYVRNHE